MLHIIAQMAGVGMFEEDWAVPVNCPAAPQGGGKPRSYYTRAWQADLAGYVSLLLISAEVSKVC